MNRRTFIKGVVSSFFILPSATTYVRKWTKQGELWKLMPEWLSAKYTLITSEEAYRKLNVGPLPVFKLGPMPNFKVWSDLAEQCNWKPGMK